MERTVMIVEETGSVRDLLRKILETSGYVVVAEADNGAEALVRYAELRPAITIMAVMIPVKNGIAATKDIVSFDKNAKVVMCSTLSHNELINAANEAGARDYICKPFTISKIQDVLHRVMLQ